MKIVIDMNLSPDWVSVFAKHKIFAVHWSTVGAPDASDRIIMQWAKENQYVVFTHDLDFGALLAATQDENPSVIQVRTQNVLPDYLEALMISAISQAKNYLELGALVTVDEKKARIRVLPLT